MSEDTTHQLADSEKIVSLLALMQKQHAVVDLAPRDGEESVKGSVAHVSAAQNHWWIAINTGRTGRNQIVSYNTLDLIGFAKDVRVEISGLGAEIDESQGRFDLIRLRIPEQLNYIQRRDCFRVGLDHLADIPAMVASTDLAAPLHCQLVDLSFEGCRLRFDDIQESPFGNAPKRLDLEIFASEDSESICLQGDIRHLHNDEENEKLYAGIYFQGTDNQMQNRVNQVVNEMQREVLKRQALLAN